MPSRLLLIGVLLVAAVTAAAVTVQAAPSTPGVTAVSSLIARVFSRTGRANAAVAQFTLSLRPDSAQRCAGSLCFCLNDLPGGRVGVSGSTPSELAAGVGHYLRQYANMTIGWPRGGGSWVFIPAEWPKVGGTVCRSRSVPWSYIMNVCTHSYSLVWYGWADWERFIDWMALSGINNFLAMTGQELVQYKVFTALGLNDTEVRDWFNGPAFLTWSRGQNEYGAKIAGPLPLSFMHSQWALQRQILNRTRSLGLTGQLPGFQGNVPIALKSKLGDSNITEAGATGWMNSADPVYGKIADLWMQTLVKDFGTDHWYQLDGYFNGGTAPWLSGSVADSGLEQQDDHSWFERGAAAYKGLNRTDPDAVWSFQGWAFVGWKSDQQATFLKSFIDATPKGKFNVIDMSVDGDGEWKKWNSSDFWGANFIWTTLHDFGGTDGMKGQLAHINQIPADVPKLKNVWGTGFTPEGIDQNPVYYQFMLEVNWLEQPVSDMTAYIVEQSHRRYGLRAPAPSVERAWALLVNSSYSQDLSVQDGTAVPHIGPGESWAFTDQAPSDILCQVHAAWVSLLDAAGLVDQAVEPFRYDLVNTGREVLAQLAGLYGKNFTDAIGAHALDHQVVLSTGNAYAAILRDVDQLVGHDQAFLLGPWLKMARELAGSATDCTDTGYETITDCRRFMEWNARVQLTTWNPTPRGAAKVPSGPVDYASKHWSGLIGDYYARRVELVTAQALADAARKQPLDAQAVERIKAEHAYNWTTATSSYPLLPEEDFVQVSRSMQAKYASHFQTCTTN